MILLVEIRCERPERPPAGAPIVVQVRDTSLEDVEAPLVAEALGVVTEMRSSLLAAIELDIPTASLDPRTRLTVFAHVDVDRTGAISGGDFITKQSYAVPINSESSELDVLVSRI